ncbi:MAG: serine hydrolase domain-containing protein [Candidatus Velthaea sp.]
MTSATARDFDRALQAAADDVLRAAVERENGVPGVVAMVTDRTQTRYAGAAGRRGLERETPMTNDTVLCLYSCSKAITSVAVMQLVEHGLLRLDDPARTYVPEIAESRVLEGFDADGEPLLRDPVSDVTIEQLLLHTSGFGYDMFSPDLVRYGKARGVPSVVSGMAAALATPLLFDPGTRWEYGISIDWAGRIVEAVRGKRLGDVLREHVFAPLDMRETGFRLTPELRARRATIHLRAADGTLRAKPLIELPQDPQLEMGGHGLYGTAADFVKFIRMILNDGAAPDGDRVLQPHTVERMARNGLGALKVRPLPGALPRESNALDFFPGLSKSWGYGWMINDDTAPTGRPAGELGWAGIANLFYWIDRRNGLGGFWATQIFPFIDPVSFPAYLDFESAVYRCLRAAQR